MAEPGAETVLGVSYGPKATLRTIHTAIERLARHPDTARHIARKLVVHFVSDAPDAYISKLCKGIVGLLLEVGEITYARKLSKDKSQQDRAGVIQAFETSNKPLERRMAKEMKKDI